MRIQTPLARNSDENVKQRAHKPTIAGNEIWGSEIRTTKEMFESPMAMKAKDREWWGILEQRSLGQLSGKKLETSSNRSEKS